MVRNTYIMSVDVPVQVFVRTRQDSYEGLVVEVVASSAPLLGDIEERAAEKWFQDQNKKTASTDDWVREQRDYAGLI